jgi:hypothetical protein
VSSKQAQSGSAKRKRREQKEKLIASQRGTLHKFLKSNTRTLRNK